MCLQISLAHAEMICVFDETALPIDRWLLVIFECTFISMPRKRERSWSKEGIDEGWSLIVYRY